MYCSCQRTFVLNLLTYSFKQQFDIIIMGDVIEHVRDSHFFMKEVYKLSHSRIVLWISTPSFKLTLKKRITQGLRIFNYVVFL